MQIILWALPLFIGVILEYLSVGELLLLVGGIATKCCWEVFLLSSLPHLRLSPGVPIVFLDIPGEIMWENNLEAG